jgi:wyosine [tRNA(Phe)-imidazoG37] synthetase (radical SAM superfamily)
MLSSSLIFGPVPSRRLGRSLGINNIPPKKCSYSCVYCQLGRTVDLQIKREVFYEPLKLARAVEERVKQLGERNEHVDYLAFVPDGEPTLDINLGKEIELLRPLGLKIAVITNGSLLWRDDVRRDLQKADWISLKVDAVSSKIWRRINRPHENLELHTVLDGMSDFARSFKGQFTTETMLIRGVNDSGREITGIVDFLAELKPAKGYLGIPIRPPAEAVYPATERSINAACRAFGKRLDEVELLIKSEGNAFASTGDAVDDLLSITAVHPMRKEAVVELLSQLDVGFEIVHEMVRDGRLVELEYQGSKFYARRLPSKSEATIVKRIAIVGRPFEKMKGEIF